MEDRFRFRVYDHRYGKIMDVDCLYDDQIDYVDGGYGYISNGDVVLMQSTGLKDKNGKLIFEGDYIDCYTVGVEKANSGSYLYSREVVKNPETNQLELDPLTGYALCKGNQEYFRIIGNIHENPELITKGDN